MTIGALMMRALCSLVFLPRRARKRFLADLARLMSRTVVTTKRSKPAEGSASVTHGKTACGKFPIRHTSRELDQTGDFILKNPKNIRKSPPVHHAKQFAIS